jgi:hypothetical protein
MLPILLAVGFIAILFFVVVAGKPDEFSVSRSMKMSAPPERIFPHVNDLRKWEAWSPWARLDPTAKSTFEGPVSGVGATMAWDGNSKIGAGRMTITESKPGGLIRFRLEFFKPMKATNVAEFVFKPEGNQTEVTWTMSGKNNFLGKIFGLFVNCDKMIGLQFEKGLADLKSQAEKANRSSQVPA